MDQRKKQFVINILRRATYKWPERWIAEKRSKLERNTYYCEDCGVISGKSGTQIDHHIPVVDPNTGFTTFDDYIERMFCDASNLRRLCISCHEAKSAREIVIRKETAQTKKYAKKNKTNKK